MPAPILRSTRISGLYSVEPIVLEDDRGFFLETYRSSVLSTAESISHRFAQGNHSRSAPGVLRGFHTEGWSKLIYASRGTAFIAVADTRPESPTFSAVETFLIGDPPGERLRIMVSEGLSNAFYAVTDVDYINDVSGEYDPSKRAGVAWDDPDLAVDWPNQMPILSAADKDWPTLRELYPSHERFASGSK